LNSTTTITATTTKLNTKTVTVRTSSAAVSSEDPSTLGHPQINTGLPISVSAPHSVHNSTTLATNTGRPLVGTGTGVFPGVSYTPGSSLLPLSNGASVVTPGGANAAMLAFGLACLLLRGQFD
jgi:hypothetical protein